MVVVAGCVNVDERCNPVDEIQTRMEDRLHFGGESHVSVDLRLRRLTRRGVLQGERFEYREGWHDHCMGSYSCDSSLAASKWEKNGAEKERKEA